MLKLPNALSGFYNTSIPNNDLFLARERVRITSGNDEIEGNAEVYFKFLPKPRVLFEVDCPNYQALRFFGNNAAITLLDRGLSGEVLLTQATRSSLTAILKEGHLDAKPLEELSYLIFHLPNFYHFIAKPISFPPESGYTGQGNRIILEAAGWKITLDSLPNTQDLIESLKKMGGHAITHVGKIERIDQSPFSTDKAQTLMSALHYFLSFTRGFWTTPILPIGINAKGEVVWEEWGTRSLDPWWSVLSWFDPHHGNMLSDIFPGFLARWQDQTWREAIRTVIHLYVESNKQAGALNGSVVLIQAALERLAWTYFVQGGQMSRNSFKKLTSDERIGQLISEAEIPLEVPASLSELSKMTQEQKLNGPEALAKARNDVVHPERKDKFSEVIFEVWNLGLWYVELILLYLFGFSGEYANRLKLNRWIGEVEPVPWAS